MPDLPVILSGAGALVTSKPASKDDAEHGWIAVFTCKSAEGMIIRITCRKATQHRPEGTVAVLEIEAPSWPGSRELREANRFLGKIELTLRQHGAIDLQEVKEHVP
jgi:hypothetical protein